MKTDEELKQIAKDLFERKIFCDRQVSNPNDLPMVFMVLALSEPGQIKKMVEEGMDFVYEYYSEAGPRSCNGYPCFFSMRYLIKEETEKMFNFYNEYKAHVGSFMSTTEQDYTI